MSPYFRRLCIGTGRALLPHRTPLDRVVIGSSSCATVESARDVRLALMGQILELAESGFRIYLSSKSDIDEFYQDVVDVLIKSDKLQVLISALPGVYNVVLASVCRFTTNLSCLCPDRVDRTRSLLLSLLGDFPQCLSAFVSSPLSSKSTPSCSGQFRTSMVHAHRVQWC